MSDRAGSFQGTTPWDIDAPQRAFIELEKNGEIEGSVLDIGCGTGDNSLYLVTKGYQVTGIDSSPTLIARALLKSAERNVKGKFLIFDCLQLEHLGTVFDTIIDSGVFHLYSDEKRILYIQSLGRVLRPGGYLHMLCFAEGDYGTHGPRRVTKGEIHFFFNEGWEVKAIRKARFETNYGRGWNWAWLASILKL